MVRLGEARSVQERALFLPVYRDWQFDGLASFDREAAAEWLRHRILFFNEDHLVIRELSCRAKRLDALKLAPFFMKIDVQGYELPVLESGQNTLQQHTPILLIENPEPKVFSLLAGLGYEPYSYIGGSYTLGGRALPNLFFMTPERFDALRPD